MNYLQITLNGFANPTTRNFLTEYFKREFIKAKEKHFEHLEFFEGCLLILNSFKEEIDREYYARKRELSFMLNLRNENETIYIEEELESLNKDCFSVNLHQATRGCFFGALWYNEIIEIENALKCAYIETLDKQVIDTAKNEKKKDYKEQNLFKLGLLFANGTMNKYFIVNNIGNTVMKTEFTAPEIARELGDESFNKYILATINNYKIDNSNGNKNIFNNSNDIMNKIITYCEAENIPVDPYFTSRLPIK